MNRSIVFACTGVALALLALPVWMEPTVRVVYNASDSVPRGWYCIVDASSPHVGDMVLARLPPAAAALAAQRGYLASGVPIVKRIGATAPQWVCVQNGGVQVDGKLIATLLSVDAHGRRMPAWQHCRQLLDGELFLLSATNPASFDSRYFGPVPASAVIGQARPTWTWGVP